MGQSTPIYRRVHPDCSRQALARPARRSTLEWAQIARLVDISPDGSWRPTDTAKSWMIEQERIDREEL